MQGRPDREGVEMLVRETIAESAVGMRQLAEDAGVSYQTVRAWASGVRVPTPESLQRLAEGLRRRAAILEELANQLEEASE